MKNDAWDKALKSLANYEIKHPRVCPVKSISLDAARKQFEETHLKYTRNISKYLNNEGILCYTVYWIDAQWVGYQKALRDIGVLKE